MWFMQDGARAQISNRPNCNVRGYITRQFGARTIGEGLGEHWPARSPELTPCDFWLWGSLKEKVYEHGPFPDLISLEAAIRTALSGIPPAYFFNACHSLPRRRAVLRERDEDCYNPFCLSSPNCLWRQFGVLQPGLSQLTNIIIEATWQDNLRYIDIQIYIVIQIKFQCDIRSVS